MLPEHIRNFSQNVAPNTFIGGIAKTGGTGVNAPINSRTLLAIKLGIDSNRISGFKVIGDNVQCKIKGSYAIPDYAFGALNLVDANQNITYFYDNDGLVNYIGYFCFRRCTVFNDFLFSSNINYLGNNCFSYTAIVNADLSYLNNSVTGEWSNLFFNCSLLQSADVGNLGELSTASQSMFVSCPVISMVSCKIKYYAQMFRLAGLPNADFYNEFVLELRGAAFNVSGFKRVELPNLTKILNESFIYSSGTRYLKEVIAPKVTSIGINGGVGLVFVSQSILELVDIRACKHFYGYTAGNSNTYNFRNACKVGGRVLVHIFMFTSNGGLPDEELTYLKTSRSAVVEFYDDFGVYVSTL